MHTIFESYAIFGTTLEAIILITWNSLVRVLKYQRKDQQGLINLIVRPCAVAVVVSSSQGIKKATRMAGFY